MPHYRDMGRIVHRPAPIFLTDRADGTIWLLTEREGHPALVTVNRINGSVRGPLEGVRVNDVRLFARDGRLGVEPIT